MRGPNVRLRGTHKKLLQNIGLGKASYFLVEQTSKEKLSLIDELLQKIENYSEPLDKRSVNTITNALLKNHFISEKDLSKDLSSKNSFARILHSRRKQQTKIVQYALELMIVDLAFSFEEFVVRVLFRYFQDNIERVSSNYTITFANIIDILKRQNVDYELVRALVFKETQENKGPESWIKFLNSLDIQVANSGDLTELFLVRNVIAHNGSIVNEKLASSNIRFAGVYELRLSYADYLRYKKVVISRAQMIREGFNKASGKRMKDPKRMMVHIRAERDIKTAQSRARRSKTTLITIGTPLKTVDALVASAGFMSLKHLKSFVDSDIFEYRYFAWKYAAKQLAQGNQSMFRFVLDNANYIENVVFARIIAKALKKSGMSVAEHGMVLEEWQASIDPMKRMLASLVTQT